MKLHKNVRIHRQKNKDQYCELPGQLVRNPYYTVSAQPSSGIISSQFQLGVTSVEFRLLLPAAICLYIFCLHIFCLFILSLFPTTILPKYFQPILNLYEIKMWINIDSSKNLLTLLDRGIWLCPEISTPPLTDLVTGAVYKEYVLLHTLVPVQLTLS